MALATSFYALMRLALRSTAVPEVLKLDGVSYFAALVLTLSFAGAAYLFGSGLSALMSPYIAILLAIGAQGFLMALAMRVTDAISSPSADARSSTANA